MLGLPSVGFSGRTKDDSHRSSLPYARHPSSSQGGYRGGTSSEDEDDRTNRLGTKGGEYRISYTHNRCIITRIIYDRSSFLNLVSVVTCGKHSLVNLGILCSLLSLIFFYYYNI